MSEPVPSSAPSAGEPRELLDSTVTRTAPFLERAPLPMVEVAGPEHRICYVNPAFCRLVDRPAEQLRGQPFGTVVRNGENFAPLLDRVYKTGQGDTYVDREILPHETAFWLYAMWPALADARTPDRVVIQLARAAQERLDAVNLSEALLLSGLRQHELRSVAEQSNALLEIEILERKKAGEGFARMAETAQAAQANAERTNLAKDNFLASLSHELRTPLTPVLLAATELREDTRLPPDVRLQLAMMERNIAVEARMVDDLLDLTRIAHGKFDFRPEPNDAHLLIGYVIDMVRSEARIKDIDLSFDPAAMRAGVTVDPVRFQEVMWNLVRNAIKFTPIGGRVAIGTEDRLVAAAEHWLRITITDSGIGIPAERLEEVFQPFDQGGLDRAAHPGGLGLGLAITREIVRLHGGRIRAESEGRNHGTTMVLDFPDATAPAQAAEEVTASGAPSPPAPIAVRHLLLVEDDASTRQALQRILTRDGHSVFATGSFHEAILAAATNRFDLVVSDLRLEGGTGLDLMRRLRDDHGLNGICLSGYGGDDDIAESRQAGFSRHLIKPVSVGALRQALAAIPVTRN